MPTNTRTISASTKASESESSRTNPTGPAASAGAIVSKGRATMEEDEMESFEDLFVDTRPVAKSNQPEPHRKAQERTTPNVKPCRFVLPEFPTSDPDPGRRAPPQQKGKRKERAWAASSRSSPATAEDTDEAEDGGAKRRARQSPVLVSPSAELREGVPPLRARELLVLPSRRGESKIVDCIELSDSEEDETRAIVPTLIKPTIKMQAKTTSWTENVGYVSTMKPKIADVSIIDPTSD